MRRPLPIPPSLREAAFLIVLMTAATLFVATSHHGGEPVNPAFDLSQRN